MKIAIYGKRRQSAADVGGIALLVRRLAAAGAFVAVEARLYGALGPAAEGLPVDDVFDTRAVADLAFSIGGDGTFLRTARAVGREQTPIVGFNTGTLGFLAEYSLDDSAGVIADIAAGRYDVEDRSMAQVDFLPTDEARSPRGREHGSPLYALNEVAILREDTASTVTVNARLDGTTLASYRGDGLLIATPTGSTAYNLSVGGPVIEPSAPCLVLSPIAPHSLTMRPLVVGDTRRIDIEVQSRVPTYRLAVDGRGVSLPSSMRLAVARAPFVTRIVHRHGATFADTLRQKLLWGAGGN